MIWKDARGKFFSYSLVSTYKLTPTEYSETILFSILNDQISGKDIVYDLSGKTQSVPINVEGGRIQLSCRSIPRRCCSRGHDDGDGRRQVC